MSHSPNTSTKQVIDLRELAVLNEAFAEEDLGWTWDADTFEGLRRIPGVMAQIDEYGFRLGEPLVAHKLYAVVDTYERLLDRTDLRRAA